MNKYLSALKRLVPHMIISLILLMGILLLFNLIDPLQGESWVSLKILAVFSVLVLIPAMIAIFFGYLNRKRFVTLFLVVGLLPSWIMIIWAGIALILGNHEGGFGLLIGAMSLVSGLVVGIVNFGYLRYYERKVI